MNNKKDLVVVATAGSVDDGKSTLIGRLLFDSGDVYEDQLDSLRDRNNGEIKKEDLAFLTDGLSSEREQKITIDVAYRHLSRPGRKFIIADVPGHEQYVRNMVTGVSKADLLLIIVDASKGILQQTKKHLFIAGLLGINHVIVAINKMDSVGYSKNVYEKIKKDFFYYAKKIGILNLQFIPISALDGDMVAKRGNNLNWYSGPTLLKYLENVEISSVRNLIDFRLAVQCVIRPNQNFRGYAGKISGGIIREGEMVTILPSNKKSKVKSIFVGDKKVHSAFESQSVVMELIDSIDLSRGDMFVKGDELPSVNSELESMLIWFSESPLMTQKSYLIKHMCKTVRCKFSNIEYVINPSTLRKFRRDKFELNDIGKVSIEVMENLVFDEYKKNKQTGNFIVIDEITSETVGAGIILNSKKKSFPNEEEKYDSKTGCVIWFTGLSGAGKSTIADRLYRKLKKRGIRVERLDGDEIRKNLNKDLGFTPKDRDENIRRVAFICELLSRNGIVVIASFVSPYQKQRADLKKKIKNFIEVYVNTPLHICEKRDIKGIYKKARLGKINNFTGISDTYQEPKNPEIVVYGDKKKNIAPSVEAINKYLIKRGYIFKTK